MSKEQDFQSADNTDDRVSYLLRDIEHATDRKADKHLATLIGYVATAGMWTELKHARELYEELRQKLERSSVEEHTIAENLHRIKHLIDSLSIFIPKKIREPFLGDLIEDLQELRDDGASRWKVGWVALTQIFLAVICNAKIWKIGIVGWLLASIRKWFA